MIKLYKKQFRTDSNRLKGHDYSLPRHYFVTICTKDKRYYLGEICDWEMRLSEIGRVAKKNWLEIPKHFPYIIRDEFVVMPNHVHGIVWIDYCQYIRENPQNWNQDKNSLENISEEIKRLLSLNKWLNLV